MRLALANLDTGLFFGAGGWTTDRRMAQGFEDTETIARVAAEKKVRNAAAAMLDGDPPKARGFLWVTRP